MAKKLNASVTVRNAHDSNASPRAYGWVVDCSVCGGLAGGGTRSQAESDARYHRGWHSTN